MGSDSRQPAARLGDIDTGHPPAVPTPIITGSSNVFINGRPAARQGDMLAPHHPGVRLITEGSASVLINGKPAARVTDAINCGGTIVTGSSNVHIGNQPGRVRNVVSGPEFDEYIDTRLKPEYFGQDPLQNTQLAADIAVKYRGPEGAFATWHDWFMSNDPEPGDMSNPAKKEGFHRAQVEKGLVAAAEPREYDTIKPGIAGFDDSTVSGSMINGVLNQVGIVTSKFRDDGMVVQPFTGVEITRPQQQEAAFNNFMGGAGGVVNLAKAGIGSVAAPAIHSVWHTTTNSRATQGVLDGIKTKFLNPESRFGRAFYVAEAPETTLAELAHHGADAANSIRFTVNSAKMKVLDLADEVVAKGWGYSGGPITDETKLIGKIAKDQGFNVIRYPSERSPTGINNAILDDFEEILRPVIVTPVD